MSFNSSKPYPYCSLLLCNTKGLAFHQLASAETTPVMIKGICWSKTPSSFSRKPLNAGSGLSLSSSTHPFRILGKVLRLSFLTSRVGTILKPISWYRCKVRLDTASKTYSLAPGIWKMFSKFGPYYLNKPPNRQGSGGSRSSGT